MTDTYGDGWNGAYWTWTDPNGDVQKSGTLATGSSGEATFCTWAVVGPCYTFEIGTQGSYPNEIGWTVMNDATGEVEATGGASETVEVCGSTTPPTVTPSLSPATPAPTDAPRPRPSASPTVSPTALFAAPSESPTSTYDEPEFSMSYSYDYVETRSPTWKPTWSPTATPGTTKHAVLLLLPLVPPLVLPLPAITTRAIPPNHPHLMWPPPPTPSCRRM
jgi:hypothetical protein